MTCGRQPEHFGRVILRITEVATNGARMRGDADLIFLDVISTGFGLDMPDETLGLLS